MSMRAGASFRITSEMTLAPRGRGRNHMFAAVAAQGIAGFHTDQWSELLSAGSLELPP